MSETKPLAQWLQEDSEKWDDKNEDSRVTAQGAQDYTYGYNAGCAEAFRASAVRVEQFAATHLTPQSEPSVQLRKAIETIMRAEAGFHTACKDLAWFVLSQLNSQRECISALLVGKGE